MVYNRWGRVGVKGQDKVQGPYTSRDSAIQEFEQKFFAKTRNHWFNRKQFISHAKSYTWLEMDYTDKEEESTVSSSGTVREFLILPSTYFSRAFTLILILLLLHIIINIEREKEHE